MGHLHGVSSPKTIPLRRRWPLILRAACTSVLLSLLFIAVYGGTNWLTALRPASDVGTWYFGWELTLIPYVPVLLVPYMSIDLVFFFAAFLCRDEQELRVFAQRIVFSILVAGVIFLLLPLKLAWPQRGVIALLLLPYNLVPSLHITLCLLVADVYGRHTHGIVRILSHTWFSLIFVSTVLTWQHHVVDVAGGLVLAGFAFYLFRESSSRLPVTPNIRVGCYYAAGAAAVLALVPTVWPWGLFLLWPAASLGIAAAAYFGVGPGIFHKEGGRLPLSTRFVLAPVLIGQFLSLLYYRRQCRAWDELAPGVLIGRALTNSEAAAAVRQGVTAVLDLTGEFPEAAPFRGTNYRNLPILDLTGPTQDQLHEAAAFIAEESAKGTVYVHCKIGYSRTAAVAGAYLLATHQAATVEEALDRLRHARPSIVIRSEAMQALRDFARSERRGVSPTCPPLEAEAILVRATR